MDIILMNIIDWKNSLLLIVLFVNLVLAFISYFKSKRHKTNIAWTIAVGTVIFWVLSMIFYRSVGQKNALLGAKILHVSAALIPLAFLYFTFIYPEGKWTINRRTQLLVALPTFLIILLIIWPNVLIKQVILKSGQERETIWGAKYFLYVFYILGYFSWPLTNLLRKYTKYRGIIRSQIAYMLVGTSIAIFLGSIFNLLMPAFGYFELNWLGQIMTLFMVGFITYAIAAYQLFDIKVLLTQILVGVIAVLLLMNVVVSETIFEYLWKSVLFITFLIFGYLLIRSVLQEIKRREEIEEISFKLQRAYEELKKLDIAKTEFISIASHQLRTPLTVIKGYISMLLEGTYGKLPQKTVGPMENVFKSNERLIKLVNNMLTISKVEMGKLEPEFEKADIVEIISDLAQEFKMQADEKGLYLKWQKPKNKLPKILIDKDKIRQALSNLLDNAIHYTEKGGIAIGCRASGGRYQIVVSDTGAGMGKEEASKMFQSFARGSAGTRLWVEGAGLGLYIAKKYIDLHKGKIWAESEGKGKGSTFFIELPIRK